MSCHKKIGLKFIVKAFVYVSFILALPEDIGSVLAAYLAVLIE